MVSIDRVYQTVLSIVNREGLSYINPQEFNLLANQAQIELFEEYFGDKARAMLQPGMDDDYADMDRNLEEKIALFENTVELMEDDNDVFVYPGDFYRLGRVFLNGIVVDEVSRKDAAYINLSPLTAPTRSQPIYVRHNSRTPTTVTQGFKIYPETMLDTDNVMVAYIRQPNEVAWVGNPNYSPLSSDFELHPSEFPELVVKILGYIGILIARQDVTQFAMGQEAEITQNEQ